MTLCAALLCENGTALVLVADKVVDVGVAIRELHVEKLVPLHPNWIAMIAGSNTGASLDVLQDVKAMLTRRKASLDCVSRVVADCYGTHRIKAASRTLLAPRGCKFQDFARQRLNATRGALAYEIDREFRHFQLGTTLLLAGFDDEQVGHILSVEHPGTVRRHDALGMHAIGSGSPSVYSMLFWRQFSASFPVEHALYLLEEAHSFGATTPYDRPAADFYVFAAGQTPKRIDAKIVESIRSARMAHDGAIAERLSFVRHLLAQKRPVHDKNRVGRGDSIVHMGSKGKRRL